MAVHRKVYGYTIALWELGKTVPSLYRKISDYKANLHIPTTSLWTGLIDPSYALWPIRRFLLPWLRNRNAEGDLWNMRHFWSNFEIADMDFFRSEAYRKLFRHLDEDGGFYYERWGDAPVHTLAAAMLLKPEQLHHFSDVGYVHGRLQYCAFAPTDDALSRGVLVPGQKEDRGEMLGCNCECDEQIEVVDPTCFNRLRRSVM
jgi:mannosyltransferase